MEFEKYESKTVFVCPQLSRGGRQYLINKRCSIIKSFRRNKYLFLMEGGGKSSAKTLNGSKLLKMFKSNGGKRRGYSLTHLQKLNLVLN